MPRRVEEVAADLEAIQPEHFDCDCADGLERLDRLCDEMHAIGDARACAPILFHTIERLDGVDLGVPGPLVHTLERWRGEYEPFLAESVHRRPTPLSVWMVNRLLNARPPDAGAWLDLLRSAAGHPLVSEEAKTAAAGFLEYQSRSGPARRRAAESRR
jgi:hypothetical protein